MEKEFEDWQADPTPEKMGVFLEAADPVIKSSLKSYAGGNEALYGKARLLAANAVKKYDPKRGTKLRTYMMTQLQPLRREARAYTNLTYVPERASTDLYAVNQANQKFFDQYGREPSEKELSDVTGLSMRRIARVRRFGKGDLAESSLTEGDDSDASLMHPGVARVDPDQVWLEYVHHDLSPIDQKILEWRTGYNGKQIISNNEIAQRLNLSPGAVSQRAARIAARVAEGQTLARGQDGY